LFKPPRPRWGLTSKGFDQTVTALASPILFAECGQKNSSDSLEKPEKCGVRGENLWKGA
jgi:hypothetical protein